MVVTPAPKFLDGIVTEELATKVYELLEEALPLDDPYWIEHGITLEILEGNMLPNEYEIPEFVTKIEVSYTTKPVILYLIVETNGGKYYLDL